MAVNTGLRWAVGPVAVFALMLAVSGCGGDRPDIERTPVGQGASAPPSRPDDASGPELSAEVRTPGGMPSAPAGWGKKLSHVIVSGYDVVDERKIRVYVTLGNAAARVCRKKVTESPDHIRFLVELCARSSGPASPGISTSPFVDISLESPLGERVVLDSEGRRVQRLIRPTPPG